METSTNDTFCSLDLLAEVASATLQNDPTLVSKRKRKKKHSSKINTNSASRKPASSSEKLSLDQIKILSDKILIDMFSELHCDEMRKTYSYQCFLIPEKCSQTFNSFGSEARARCKMKNHLHSHINDLTSRESESDMFTAEPLHVRRKRLQDLNSKNVRKRKKSKQQVTKKKKDDFSDTFLQTFCGEIKNQKPKNVPLHNKTSKHMYLEPKINKYNYDPGVDSFEGRNVDSSTDEFMDDSLISLNLNSNEETSNDSSDSDMEELCTKTNRKYLPNSSRSNYVVKWNVDFESNNLLDNSSVLDFEDCHSETNLSMQSQHDHTYTSVLGKTFDCDLYPDECNRGIGRSPSKSPKKVHRCIKPPLIINTPPYPYIYVPILPHIAAMEEVAKNSKSSCGQCSNTYLYGINDYVNSSNIPHSNIKDKELFNDTNELEDESSEENDSFFEEDENYPSDSFLNGDDDTNSECSDEKLPDSTCDVEDLLKTDCPENLQSVEKKLALKCIRALRTKKKDERGPLVCQICKNKTFTAQATLMYHYRSHAGIKPFSCTVCEATFTRQHSLNYHMLIHNNKSRFVCTDCGRNFRHPSHYKEHLRRHTGETPYECTDCNLR